MLGGLSREWCLLCELNQYEDRATIVLIVVSKEQYERQHCGSLYKIGWTEEHDKRFSLLDRPQPERSSS